MDTLYLQGVLEYFGDLTIDIINECLEIDNFKFVNTGSETIPIEEVNFEKEISKILNKK